METKLIARAKILIQASVQKVWSVLTDPEDIKEYMFGTTVVTDWKEGSPIVWKGEWKGKNYEDKGTVLKYERPTTLQYSHYSPLSGAPDLPENYHAVTIHLAELETGVEIVLIQDNNTSEEEKEHSEKNWGMMLEGLKKYIEGK